MTPDLPLEFVVRGTAISLQASSRSRIAWKDQIRAASTGVVPPGSWSLTDRLAVTIFYFPEDQMLGDIDNIVKPILDAMSRSLYVDDSQVDRVVVQRFGREELSVFASPTPALLEALSEPGPAVYIRVSGDPHEELQ